MIVTPLLAFLGYYLVDMVVKEKPKSAVKGQSYQLVAKSNCRYTSGECDLVNGTFKSTLRVTKNGPLSVLVLTASHPLKGVTIGFVNNEQEQQPSNMMPDNADAQSWSMTLIDDVNQETTLRVAIQVNDSYYFAQTKLGFTEYQTSFGKTF